MNLATIRRASGKFNSFYAYQEFLFWSELMALDHSLVTSQQQLLDYLQAQDSPKTLKEITADCVMHPTEAAMAVGELLLAKKIRETVLRKFSEPAYVIWVSSR